MHQIGGNRLEFVSCSGCTARGLWGLPEASLVAAKGTDFLILMDLCHGR